MVGDLLLTSFQNHWVAGGALIGRPGVTCDACNQYFGQKVESKALRSFPFIEFRVLAGIPSKKGAMPSMATTIGDVHATGRMGIVELQPRTTEVASRIVTGEVSQLRLLAEVTEPLAVCGYRNFKRYFSRILNVSDDRQAVKGARNL